MTLQITLHEKNCLLREGDCVDLSAQKVLPIFFQTVDIIITKSRKTFYHIDCHVT